jgi:hypothetical protein
MSYQLNDPLVTISEEVLLLSINNARTAMRWDPDPEHKLYWQGHIDAYTSLLKGQL